MDKQGPAVKHTPVKFSSCRGVAFEIKPSQVSPFAVDADCAAEQPPTVSNGGADGSGSLRLSTANTPCVRPSAVQQAATSATWMTRTTMKSSRPTSSRTTRRWLLQRQQPRCLTCGAGVGGLSHRRLSQSGQWRRRRKGTPGSASYCSTRACSPCTSASFVLCAALNAAGIAAAATGHFPYANGHAALFAMGNILALTLCRSELVLRAVFWLAVALLGRPWVPVAVKTAVTAILQSLGGVHSGCGVSSLAWLVYALVRAVEDSHATPREIVGVAGAILGLLALSCLAAFPLVRHLHHNVFERTHRFAGWTALALLWVFVLLSTGYDPTTTSYSRFTVASLAKSQELWLAAAITFFTFLPWLSVRRVPVTVTAPSTHASIITFQGGVKAGLLGRISRSPLSEWHAFGIISDDGDTHSLLAGAVGDFTRGLVSDPPSYLWVRRVHFAGLPYLISMYQRVTMVATGSGICVFLSFVMQQSSAEVSLVWVAKGIDANYGDGMSAMLASNKILGGRVIVHDTATMGRPNVADLTVGAARRWNAEAVIVTSNPEGSKDVVSGCKKAGIPAFGPIWDS